MSNWYKPQSLGEFIFLAKELNGETIHVRFKEGDRERELTDTSAPVYVWDIVDDGGASHFLSIYEPSLEIKIY